ncbi:hypothetical protein [Chryseobacterium cucumeris]|nr:hypothetical protein [Chryseobacterium cucumeris]
MKNFLLSLLTIFMTSSFIFANHLDNDRGGNKRKKAIKTAKIVKNNSKKEEKVDSFKIVSETSGEEAGRQFCRITVNYYFQGQFVSQQTYTGYTCPIFGEFNCRQWRENTMETINYWIDHYGTGVPAGTDMTC